MYLTIFFVLLMLTACMVAAKNLNKKSKKEEKVIDMLLFEDWKSEDLNTSELLILIDYINDIYSNGLINKNEYDWKISKISRLIEAKLFTEKDTLQINDCLSNIKRDNRET